MTIQSKKVLLSIIPGRVKKLMEIGRENRMHCINGSLKHATICSKIITFFIEVHSDPDVKAHLEKSGGTLLDLILRALKRYITEKRH